MVSQAPAAPRPAAIVTPRTIILPWPVPITPVSAVSVLVPVPAPGPGCARLAPAAAGAGVTSGSRCAMLPVLPSDRPGTVPRGSAVGLMSPVPAEVLPA
jgi:hypothetical protein